MRAAVVNQLAEPLRIEDRPVPDAGPDQVVVRIEASGLCHTDIHAARGDWPVPPTAWRLRRCGTRWCGHRRRS